MKLQNRFGYCDCDTEVAATFERFARYTSTSLMASCFAARAMPHPELTAGDRVEGLGDFGKPTAEFGTIERSNEDDAIVKWDDDRRTRVHQPWLKRAQA